MLCGRVEEYFELRILAGYDFSVGTTNSSVSDALQIQPNMTYFSLSPRDFYVGIHTNSSLVCCQTLLLLTYYQPLTPPLIVVAA